MEQQPYHAAAPNHTMAVVSLILGILGVIGILPLIGSVAAIITGNIARNEITANPSIYSGEGMARAGVILGWIGVAFGGLACCVAAGAFAFIFLVAGTESFSLLSMPFMWT